MQLYIKNMVCDRCILVVRQLLDQMNVEYKQIQLGMVELKEEMTPNQLEKFGELVSMKGFELLDDKKARLVENIKITIISLIQGYSDLDFNKKLSVILVEKLQHDYHFLTTLFSAVEGVTIEKFVILQRIEKVKELLMYGEMNMSEISYELGYSSVQHLSQQFKKITGFTPTQFRQLKGNNRKPLDKV